MELSNLRRNPIDGSTSARAITDEEQTVAELVELPGIYGFNLQDRPVAGTVSIVTDDTAATPFTIVLTTPAPGQVFVDFNTQRGMCIFHQDDAGTAVLCSYDGLGSNVTTENLAEFATFTGKTTDDLTEGTTNKHFTATEKTKLSTIETAASASNKATIDDNDRFLGGDSAASNSPVYWLWSLIKSTLKTYLDTLYAALYVRAEWRADTFAGYGSTDNKIPYFTNVRVDVDTGNSITVVNDSTNGCKITIDKAGVYAVSFSAYPNDVSDIGFSLNSNQLTTNIIVIDAEDRIAFQTNSGGNRGVSVAWCGYLSLNDVIRPHTDGTGTNAGSRWHFSIVRVA